MIEGEGALRIVPVSDIDLRWWSCSTMRTASTTWR